MRWYEDRQDLWGRLVLKRGEAWIDILGTALMLGSVSVGAVGLLALFTAPLPLGLLGYHMYLIWAGMTTNENGKWADLRDDMADGLVWMRDQDENGYQNGLLELDETAGSRWPVKSTVLIKKSFDGRPPDDDSRWRRVWRLREVENVYDLGFWASLKDVLRN